MTQGLTPRRWSGSKNTLDTLFGFDKYRDSKRDPKNRSKDNVKILVKYSTLDEAFPSFLSFLADPMAHSYFKSYLHSKIFKDFFQPDPQDPGTYVLNVDSALKRDLSEAIKGAPTCTSAVFKNALDLVLQQMHTEWHSFKQTPQGRALLDNLNTATYTILPNPETRDPVALPAGWDPKDDPVNWGLAVN